ncbi:SDR family NAD(P)-dependent oxidoreductase [Bradyrhizobium hipponense]|uniref:SDR family NAD(P)-dependent oxidoreductase n=1 Tax=Bradyrhizobium hipponense TaxID=2605638 RepID=A0A5S4YWY0_9BRAD|nr:SDR family NAD(P)-dependent oxidoreductase [Bradyrhizobium hipponense]TYO65649.1 SDR family NAD(P)-dependent oxidoreductase [Bradyrhizobium hipponense]
MTGRLEGKMAIVTGAVMGIGEAIAHKFAREGAKVVVAGLSTDPVEDVVRVIRAHGGTAEAFLGDLADEVDAQACVALALDAFGGLDVLINNAGVFPSKARANLVDDQRGGLVVTDAHSRGSDGIVLPAVLRDAAA